MRKVTGGGRRVEERGQGRVQITRGKETSQEITEVNGLGVSGEEGRNSRGPVVERVVIGDELCV